jgi:hypothetical protein
MVTQENATLTPQLIADNYCRAFEKVNGRQPQIRHLGGPWYYINGETVHRVAVLAEITRLRDLVRRPNMGDKGMIQRLIDKLRRI